MLSKQEMCESMLGDDRMLLEIIHLSFTTTVKDSDKEKEERKLKKEPWGTFTHRCWKKKNRGENDFKKKKHAHKPTQKNASQRGEEQVISNYKCSAVDKCMGFGVRVSGFKSSISLSVNWGDKWTSPYYVNLSEQWLTAVI